MSNDMIKRLRDAVVAFNGDDYHQRYAPLIAEADAYLAQPDRTAELEAAAREQMREECIVECVDAAKYYTNLRDRNATVGAHYCEQAIRALGTKP